MIRKIILWVLISIGIVIALYFLFLCFLVIRVIVADLPGKQELTDNFEAKETEILELKSFYKSIVPKGYSAHIEFKNNEEIDLAVFDYGVKGLYHDYVTLYQQWNINPYSDKEETLTPYDSTEYNRPRTNSLSFVKQKLKWDDGTFRQIKKMLDNANCIGVGVSKGGVSNGEPATIDFVRSGMGMYSYIIYENPIPDSLIVKYENNCSSIVYNDKVVLKFGGGAFTSDCFPQKDRE